MIKLSKDNTKRQLSIHGWMGLILGFLLYVIVFTGTVVVFMEELSQWSFSGHVVAQPLNPSKSYSIDRIINGLANQVPESHMDEIMIYVYNLDNIEFLFSSNKDAPELEESVITNYLINPHNLEIIATGDEIYPSATNSWLVFIREFHANLYIPWKSRYIVGMFGIILLISSISGFLLHRHLIKDMFLSPRKSTKTIEQRDGHNLVGTWSLPFAFIIGLTGSVICFDTRVGDRAMIASVKNAESVLGFKHQSIDEIYKNNNASKSNKLSTKATIDSIIKSSTSLAGAAPYQLDIEGYTHEKTLITTYHQSTNIENDIFHHGFLFNGQGDFIQEFATYIGDKPTVSSRSFQLTTTLHYGNFAGWLSKLIWFMLSGILCYVTITGFNLWFEKRIKQPKWQRLYPSVPIMIYGVPVSLVTAGFGFFMSYYGGAGISEISAIWIGFGVGWLLCLLSLLAIKFNPNYIVELFNNKGYVISSPTPAMNDKKNSLEHIKVAMANINQYFRVLLSLVLLALPLVRLQSSQIGWSTLISNHNSMVVVIDVFFIIIGLAFFAKFLKSSNANLE